MTNSDAIAICVNAIRSLESKGHDYAAEALKEVVTWLEKSRLTWSDEKPTTPGWYWRQDYDDCEPTIGYYDPKNWFGHEWMQQLDGQFAGPIPAPTSSPASPAGG